MTYDSNGMVNEFKTYSLARKDMGRAIIRAHDELIAQREAAGMTDDTKYQLDSAAVDTLKERIRSSAAATYLAAEEGITVTQANTRIQGMNNVQKNRIYKSAQVDDNTLDRYLASGRSGETVEIDGASIGQFVNSTGRAYNNQLIEDITSSIRTTDAADVKNAANTFASNNATNRFSIGYDANSFNDNDVHDVRALARTLFTAENGLENILRK